jgi:anti-sigma regulatory factor (Ser/Thr protein kinase)
MESETRNVSVFRARMSALADVEHFVHDVCTRTGVARDLRLKLSLLVEELFTNTVRHGYGRDTDEEIVLAIEASPGRLTLTYEDTAPPHDPFTPRATAADPSTPVEAEVGGVGLRLVAGMSRAEYRYADGRNRISLSIEAP